MSLPRATHDYSKNELDAALEFLKRTRSELRQLRSVRVWRDRLQVIDVNKDFFEIRHVGYEHPEIVPLLRAVNTAFNPRTIHDSVDHEYKEFDTGRRHCWAEDRVM